MGNKKKILEGALIGATLGIVAGMLMAPKKGNELSRDIKKISADFYKSIAPKLKRIKRFSEKEYKIFVKKAAINYSKAKKLSAKESKILANEAQKSWDHLKNIV